jgi:DNA replication and repair protein RecF
MEQSLSVDRLTLSNFRNYESLRVETGGYSVVLTGANGAGKTNLLEAVSMLVPGRGLRGAAFEDISRRGVAGGWAVAAHSHGPMGDAQLGTAWRPGSGRDGEAQGSSARQVRINGEAQKSSGPLGDYIRVVWLTPAMDRLFAGPAGDRRRFMDRLTLAFDPQHNSRSLAFERLMRERNRILSEPRFDTIWLSGIEEQLAEAGVAVAAARAAALDALKAFIAQMSDAGEGRGFPRAEIEIAGELEQKVTTIPAVQVEDEYRKLLHDSRLRDQQAGRTLAGPHRSDLQVVHSLTGVEARLCSTGEQKALLIAITIAHARAVRAAFDGWAPVLLLDEIAAHLDAERRAGLFEEIEALGSQAWMTGTDQSLFETARGNVYKYTVADGSVQLSAD